MRPSCVNATTLQRFIDSSSLPIAPLYLPLGSPVLRHSSVFILNFNFVPYPSNINVIILYIHERIGFIEGIYHEVSLRYGTRATMTSSSIVYMESILRQESPSSSPYVVKMPVCPVL